MEEEIVLSIEKGEKNLQNFFLCAQVKNEHIYLSYYL